jgi:hypothetical protein
MVMKGKINTGTKGVINYNITEQINSFSCLGYTITISNNRVVV